MGGQILFFVSVGTWAAVETWLQVFRRGRGAPGTVEKISKYVMLAVFAVAGFGARIVSPDFAAGFREPFTPVRWAGACLVAASVALRVLAVVQLGPAYSVDLRVEPGRPLVTTGLYGRIRHPGYLSLIAAFVGVGLAFWHPVATALCLLLPPAAIAWRIGLEETFLERSYGEDYLTWARRTKRLVPFVV